MPVNDELGKRMKEYYETVSKTKLTRRTPVAIRVDGKAFHTFTRGFVRPFDDLLIEAMQDTMKYLCENIQGCVLGYTQSDEITLILIDYKKLNSAAWFDYEVQKICSVSASMATLAFNKSLNRAYDEWGAKHLPDWYEGGTNKPVDQRTLDLMRIYSAAIEKGAMFDSRCFNIPKEEVTNLLYWRQIDATRNSIQMLGQAHLTHKELQGMSCNDIQNILFSRYDINWNDLPTHIKRGSCCIKEEYLLNNDEQSKRTRWIIDKKIPIFKEEGRKYVDSLIII